MFNVCYACGLYCVEKPVEPAAEAGMADAICPACGHRHRFRRMPLLVVSGASGAGKSTVCQHLAGVLEAVVMLDIDILWRPEFDRPETNYRDFFETWLRMAKNIGQAGRPVVLVGAGAGVPQNLDACLERRYFGALHSLALVCDDDMLAARLRGRPAWRQSGDDATIAGQQQFNRWFRMHGPEQTPAIDLLDTSALSLDETIDKVATWVNVTRQRAVN